MFDDRLGSTFRENGRLPASVALAASQQVAQSQMKIARELRAAKAAQSDRETPRNEVDRELEARAEGKRQASAASETARDGGQVRRAVERDGGAPRVDILV